MGGGGGGLVVPGAPEGSTGRLIFVVFGEARDLTCDPWASQKNNKILTFLTRNLLLLLENHFFNLKLAF